MNILNQIKNSQQRLRFVPEEQNNGEDESIMRPMFDEVSMTLEDDINGDTYIILNDDLNTPLDRDGNDIVVLDDVSGCSVRLSCYNMDNMGHPHYLK